MTNAGQSVTYYFTDVKAPTVTVGNQTIEVVNNESHSVDYNG